MKLGLVFGALAGASVALVVSSAMAADYGGRKVWRGTERSLTATERGYTGRLPSCADPQVESRITSNFAHTERTYWNSAIQLTAFTRQREVGFMPWGDSFIPRRFCSATSVTTDGRKREVVYSIREWQAWGTIDWGVEWCVTGMDRSYAYAPHCRMARP